MIGKNYIFQHVYICKFVKNNCWLFLILVVKYQYMPKRAKTAWCFTKGGILWRKTPSKPASLSQPKLLKSCVMEDMVRTASLLPEVHWRRPEKGNSPSWAEPQASLFFYSAVNLAFSNAIRSDSRTLSILELTLIAWSSFLRIHSFTVAVFTEYRSAISSQV